MENNEANQDRRPQEASANRGSATNAPQDAAKRRRSHRGGRRHHNGNSNRPAESIHPPVGDLEGAVLEQRSNSSENRPAGSNGRPHGKHPGQNRPGGQGNNGSGRPDRGGRQSGSSASPNGGNRSRTSDITPVRAMPVRDPFPFAAEIDEDPIAGVDFEGLTAENYLDDPLCFAGTEPIPAVKPAKSSEAAPESVSDPTTTSSGFVTATVSEVIGVRFRGAGKIYYFAPGSIKAAVGDAVIVETARGMEFGDVMIANKFIPANEVVAPLRPAIRLADENDRRHDEDNHRREIDAFRICREKIAAHELDMKLVEAQYTFDNAKLLFYFTSDGRVDFRELVKDLASVFHTRIELRQIGIRDEAKLLGGLGVCGRPLCCASFLSDFGQVSIKMAKEQNLSLNSSKISGLCGRLMCCLRYEHDVYAEETRLTPPVDTMVRTADGIGRVTAINPLAGTVRVYLTDSPDAPQRVYHRDKVEVLPKFHSDRPQARGAKRADRPTREDPLENTAEAPDQKSTAKGDSEAEQD